jgi:exopolyphosphatase / guanosine-5'-triphosphate,3'-diphosphate pyrophosphatase
MRIGVLDVGSTTAHLVIADPMSDLPVPVHAHKRPLRLAEKVDASGRLGAPAAARIADAVAEAVAVAREWQVRQLFAYATAVVRDAPDCDDVLAAVRARAGIGLSLLGGTEEAALTFLAARRWLGGQAGPLLMLDVGGGTMEIAYGQGAAPQFAVSLPIGAARLTRELLHGDPPRAREVKALRRHVRECLDDVARRLRWDGGHTAVAASRMFQQLAQMCGAPPMRKGPFVVRKLRRTALKARLDELAGIPAARRAELPGISAARARQSLAGALVAYAAMTALRVDEVTVSPWGLREGILVRRLESAAGWADRAVTLPDAAVIPLQVSA